MSITHSIRIALLIMLVLAPYSTTFSQTEVEAIDFYGTTIPILASERAPITGIDFDRLLRQWIPDFDAFQVRRTFNRSSGLTFSYSIPYPDGINKFNPEDVSKIDNPDDFTRSIRIQFGVFSSHKEALFNAIDQYGPKASPPSVSYSPGFVSIGLFHGSGLIVRDNAYFWVNVKGEGVNELVNAEKIDSALINEVEGVYREESFSPPSLDSPHLFKNPIIYIENNGSVQVRYSNPSGLPIYVFCRGYASEEKDITAIRATWDKKNETAVITGPEGSEGILRIAAANHYGAVSEERSIRFKIVPAGQADDFTQSAVQSSVEYFR